MPYVANQGFFKAYDGRKLIVPSLHKTLAGILQVSESIVMKHSQVKWINDLKSEGIRYKPVGWIHDEWQTEVIGTREEAERVATIQKESIRWAGEELGFKCPLAGSGDIGKNWAETH